MNDQNIPLDEAPEPKSIPGLKAKLIKIKSIKGLENLLGKVHISELPEDEVALINVKAFKLSKRG